MSKNHSVRNRIKTIRSRLLKVFLFANLLLTCNLYSSELTCSEIENSFSYETTPNYGGTTYIRYQGMAHLFIPASNSDVLLVAFHGAVGAKAPTTDKIVPIFRLYNLKIQNQPHVLCFSDFLLDLYKYENLRLGWYMDTKKSKQRDLVEDMVKYYVEKYSIRHIVFFGSSGGGHVAVDMASRFNQVALISNSIFNLEGFSYFSIFSNILSKHNDEILNFEIEELLRDKPGPSKCISYSNVDDFTAIDHHHLDNTLNTLFPGVLETYYFSGAQTAIEQKTSNHSILFPEGISAQSVLEDYFYQLTHE